MKATDLLNSVIELCLGAVDDYLDMSRDGCAWDTPEYWLRSEVARLLRQRHGFGVWLELGVEKLFLEFFERPVVPVTIRPGNLDLALFEPAAVPKDDNFFSIIELKPLVEAAATQPRPRDMSADAARIRGIDRELGPVIGIVAGMFVGDANSVTAAIASRLGIAPTEVVCRLAAKPDNRGYRYGALGAIVTGV